MDKSLIIAEKYTKKIKIVEPEQDQGSTALRNIGIKEANGDWILVLNADEELAISNRQLVSHMENEKIEGYYITVKNLIPLKRKTEVMLLEQLRLFRNNGYYFEGVVSEDLFDSITIPNPEKEVGHIAGEILHFGYLDKDNIHKKVSMLEEILTKGKEVFYIKWLLGFYCYIINDYDKASLHLLDSWQMCKNKEDGLHIALILSKLFTINDKHHQNIEFTARAIQIYPTSVDIHYQRGISYIYLRLPAMAIESLNLCKKTQSYTK